MKLMSVCEDREQAAHALSQRLAEVLSSAIDRKGVASLVVSGGTSPLRLFELLRQYPLNWSKVSIIPSDERLVPMESSERNEAMIHTSLLTGPASEASLVSLVSDPDDAAACEEFANNNVSRLNGPFDAVVLGMGDDGHTASLFPDAPKIETALASEKDCIVLEVPSQKRIRISLTPKALLNSGEINILAFGETKRDVLNNAQAPGPVKELPIRIALHQSEVPVTTYWAP